MSSHSTTTEQRPVLVTSTALTFALIIIGLIIFLFNFSREMGGGHEAAGHGTTHKTATPHGAAHNAEKHAANAHEAH